MQDNRKREIRSKADSFRVKCRVSRYGIIDLFKECERLEYKLFRYPLGENADLGFTVKKDDDIIIFTNSCSRLSREIFTLAHEIGHVVLHFGDDNSFVEDSVTINGRSVDEKEQEKLAKRLQENKFDMNDLYAQFEQIEKMGSISSLIKMIPGVAGKVKEEDIDERRMYRTKAIISSMTKKEREKPSIIDAKRKRRIAAGSGTKVEDVNQLLKQFDGMQKMMKQMGLKGGKKRKFPKFPMGGMGGMNGMGGFPV